MDRVFCISLDREVSALEAEKYYKQGVITHKNDFACLDEKCRAEYTFVNIENKKPKVPPYFRTAKKSSKPHIKGCKHNIEEKKVGVIPTDKPRQSRNILSDESNYIFNTSRSSGFFTRTIETPLSPSDFDEATDIRKLKPTSTDQVSNKPTNNNIYSISDLLHRVRSKYKELFINGRAVTLNTFLRIIDNNLPEKKDGLIYCGLGEVIGSTDNLLIRFCRGFRIGGDIYRVLIDIDNALLLKDQRKLLYYNQMLENTNIELAKTYKSSSKTAFIYVYGIPEKIKGTKNYIIKATSLDMCLIEHKCSNTHLFPRHIYDIEENKHLLSQPQVS
ncbi:hypothetical protein [Pseudomonas sp. Irchel s3b5]|uniref:hypothetical protein n=1 Tax=Pseudomonas sp. Irchel s3b5 TaxID=2009077 RepID=UPI000BA3A5AC|nr:hypothetical protein [Pseudomonas sp. Irchel s3b5]